MATRDPTGPGSRRAGAEHRAPVAVPHRSLSNEALDGVIEAFVLREGTDYGEREIDHAEKVREVRRQIERGEAHVVYDPRSDSVDIVATVDLPAGETGPPR